MKRGWRPNPKFPERLMLQGKGFHIEYFPKTSGVETWLIRGMGNYSLKGDFRKPYEALVPKGFLTCLRFYLKNWPEHRSDSDRLIGCKQPQEREILAWHGLPLDQSPPLDSCQLQKREMEYILQKLVPRAIERHGDDEVKEHIAKDGAASLAVKYFHETLHHPEDYFQEVKVGGMNEYKQRQKYYEKHIIKALQWDVVDYLTGSGMYCD